MYLTQQNITGHSIKQVPLIPSRPACPSSIVVVVVVVAVTMNAGVRMLNKHSVEKKTLCCINHKNYSKSNLSPSIDFPFKSSTASTASLPSSNSFQKRIIE